MGRETLRFVGSGKVVTDVVALDQGLYKIRYKMPSDKVLKVMIVNIVSGDKDEFIFEKGKGEKTYYVKRPGRFVLEIDDAGKHLAWEFDFDVLS
jgi:hypothetical protein